MKCTGDGVGEQVAAVVPHEGTWIEILKAFEVSGRVKSFPTRERGLKLPCICDPAGAPQSFPTRERGLKSPESITNCFAIGRSPRGNVD